MCIFAIWLKSTIFIGNHNKKHRKEEEVKRDREGERGREGERERIPYVFVLLFVLIG